MGQLNIYASPLPFSNKRVKVNAAVGSTVLQIIDEIIPPDRRGSDVAAIVTINGEVVLQRHWKRIRPKEGTLINVRIVPTGGGGGKNPIATLLSVVVLIAAPYVGAAFGAATGGWIGSTFFGTGFLSGVARAAFSVVGGLLVNALAPPPKPSNFGQASNPQESPTQFIEGAQNVLDPFGVVPINLGTNRMFPKKAGRPFTEAQGNDQYVRELFLWGVGNKVALSELKIGDDDIANFSDVEMEHRLNGDLNQGTALYPNDPFQEDFSVLLKEVDGYTERVTQANSNEAIVDFTFPNGLFRIASNGKRVLQTVQLEMQYALDGVSPAVWSPAVDSYTAFSGDSIVVDGVAVTTTTQNIGGSDYYVGYRKDILVVDIYSGAIYLVRGTAVSTSATPAEPKIPSNTVRLATAVVLTKQKVSDGTETTSIESFNDDRDPSLYGGRFEDSGDFVPSYLGTTISATGGSIKVDDIVYSAAQSEALRVSKRVVFPAQGTYRIRARRVSADTSSDSILDKVYLTAIKSINYASPVDDENVNGTALRIRGSNQLNGTVSQFNGVVSSVIPDYDVGTDTWVDRISSNPASLYIFVLQGCGNAKPLDDIQIDWDAFTAWHATCIAENYTYNRVIDYETTVDEVLRDIAAAGAASPSIVDGKRSIVVDKPKDDVVQIVTPRNSWGYSGEMTYPQTPHAFRVQFRNADKGYQQDERIVYDDGYNEDNATIFETLELQSCTNASLAFKTGRRHIATARLRPETHTFMMDVENLVALRGDRIKLAHDIPITSVGDGRVKAINMTGGSPNLVASLDIDDTVTIPSVGDYYVRVRLQDGSFVYRLLTTDVGPTKTLTFAEPFAMPQSDDSPAVDLLNAGDLLYVVEAGGEVDLIITRIEPQDDLSARITAVDYAPEIFTAESASIPSWSSNITTPLEFIRPLPPMLLSTQSDESVMLRNSDGSFLTRAIFTLENENKGDISVLVQARLSGTDNYAPVNVLESTPERVIITGLEDGSLYDLQIRYKRFGSNVMSVPLQLNNFVYIGASAKPSQVQNFRINVTGENALFTWDKNPEIDISHYIMLYSGLFEGAEYATSQIIEEKIYDTRIVLPFRGGTYFIKAVDILGNVSDDPTAIITYNSDNIRNVIEVLVEEPAFAGTKDNVTIEAGNSIVLADTDLGVGYYYFNDTVDLTDKFVSFVSAVISANGTFVNNVFDIEDIFEEVDIFGAGGNDLFDIDDVGAMDDVFGIGSDGWRIELQYRITDDDTGGSPVTWGEWTALAAGNLSFRGIQFRLKLESLTKNVSPRVTILQVTIDMPDRIVRGEDIECDNITGATVVYDPAFKNNPSVAITIQDGAADDRLEFISKDETGFTVKIYNITAMAYVDRTFDYITSGYGRVIT